MARTRSTALDILRCLAILLVLAHHYSAQQDAPLIYKKIAAVFQRGGWCGVDLFFVLSGFLISGLLFSSYSTYGKLDVKRFLLRRALRIYPPFWLLLAFFVGYTIWQGQMVPWGCILREFLFITNYWPGVFDHTWSLGVEEHFYLALPFLLLALTHHKPRSNDPFASLPMITIGIMFSALVMRVSYRVYGVQSFIPIGTATHLRFDSLMVGVLLSYFHHFHTSSLKAWILRYYGYLVALSCIGFIVAFGGSRGGFVMTFGLTLISLGFGALLLIAMEASHASPVQGITRIVIAVSTFVGAHSYSIYLWHRLAQSGSYWFVHNVLSGSWLLDLIFYFGLSIAIGVVTARIVEIPVLRARDRLFP